MSAAATPEWLTRLEPGLCPCCCIGKRRKGGYVEKTIAGGAALARRAVFSDEVAARPGFLQRIDPRVKISSVVALLLVAALVRHMPVLGVLFAATVGLAAASSISVPFFVKRVTLFVPLFTGVIALPATLSLVTPGHVVVPLGTWLGSPVGLTEQGLASAGLLVLRVATSVSLATLLTLTTPWSQLLGGLRRLFVPAMFVTVLAMAYRYVFLLLGTVTDMYTARKARAAGVERDTAQGRGFVAASAGALFGKAHALSEEVHMAMVSRGYTGEVRTTATPRVRKADVVVALLCLAACISVLGFDRVVAR